MNKNWFQSEKLKDSITDKCFGKYSSFMGYYILRNILQNIHCVKSVCILSYSGPYFPTFWLNTERYSVSLRVQSECGKIRTRIIPNMDTFYAVYSLSFLLTLTGIALSIQLNSIYWNQKIVQCNKKKFYIFNKSKIDFNLNMLKLFR